MLNRCVFIGRLTRDPELKSVPTSGASVTSFTIAVERDVKNKKTGQRDVDFIDVVAWNSLAEFVAQYFQKGRQVYVEGRLQIRQWKTKDGALRHSPEIVADRAGFADSVASGQKRETRTEEENCACSDYSAVGMKEDPFVELDEEDIDLPF